MATLDDVATLALGLPDVVETDYRDRRAWSVRGKPFAWERPFSKADIKRYGDEVPPELPVLGVRTDGLVEKEALLADPPPGVFHIPHFNGYPGVLVELGRVSDDDLRDVLLDAWLAMAPAELANRHRTEQD
jgi:hypothetical protein